MESQDSRWLTECAPVPDEAKKMKAKEHTAKEHGHASREGTTFRIIKDIGAAFQYTKRRMTSVALTLSPGIDCQSARKEAMTHQAKEVLPHQQKA